MKCTLNEFSSGVIISWIQKLIRNIPPNTSLGIGRSKSTQKNDVLIMVSKMINRGKIQSLALSAMEAIQGWVIQERRLPQAKSTPIVEEENPLYKRLVSYFFLFFAH